MTSFLSRILQPAVFDHVAYRLLPEDAMAARIMQREARAYERLLRRLGVPWRPVPLGAAPEGHVASCTSGEPAPRHSPAAERARFFTLGYQVTNCFLRALADAGYELPRIRSLYEFGCGAGKLIRLLRGIDGLRLVASDLDVESVSWCRAEVPGPEYHVNQALPPLSFARDGEFDVVIAAGVLPLIHPDHLGAWILELGRVIRPGGALLCTFPQEDLAGKHLGAEEQATLEREGQLVIGPDHPKVSATSRLLGVQDVYLTRARVDALFRDDFELCIRRPLSGPEVLVLRRLAGTVGRLRPAGKAGGVRDGSLAKGLVGHWLAGNAGGARDRDAQDISTGQRHGGIKGALPEREGGIEVMRFDGQESGVEVPHDRALARTKDLSILAWVRKARPNDSQRWEALVTKGPKTYDYEFLVSKALTDQLAFYSPKCKPYEVYSGVTLAIERWQHVAVTVSGDTVRFYIDGTLVNETAMVGVYPRTDGALQIGYDGNPGNGFDGLMHDVMLYDRALGDEELRAVWLEQKAAFHG